MIDTYHYSAFGEEIVFDAKDQKTLFFQAGNPWRFASKRIDPETGWIHFGRRHSDQ